MTTSRATGGGSVWGRWRQRWSELATQGALKNHFKLATDTTVGSRTLTAETWVVVGVRVRGGRIEPYGQTVDGEELSGEIEERELDGFRIQKNLLRRLRPGLPKQWRVGRQPDVALTTPESCLFKCVQPDDNLSLHRREAVGEITLPHGDYLVVQNVSIIAPGFHGLMVPGRGDGPRRTLPHEPQELTLEILEDLFHFHRTNPGPVGFFNGLNAGGTVSHFHWQLLHLPHRLAIEPALARQSGGVAILGDDYPVRALVWALGTDPEDVFRFTERCRCAEPKIPYNLVVVSPRVYLIPRDRDHEVVPEFPTGVLASAELSGLGITDDEQLFATITAEDTRRAMAKTTLTVEAMKQRGVLQ